MTIRPYVMHESGAIPGVPGPNGGLWPGGQTVYVDMDAMSVIKISLIGGSGDAESVSVEEKPAVVVEQPPVAPPAEPVEEHPASLLDEVMRMEG